MVGPQADPMSRFQEALLRLERADARARPDHVTPASIQIALAALADLAADLPPDQAENAHEVLGDAAGRLAQIERAHPGNVEYPLAQQIHAWRDTVLTRFESDPIRFRIVAIKTAEQLIRRYSA